MRRRRPIAVADLEAEGLRGLVLAKVENRRDLAPPAAFSHRPSDPNFHCLRERDRTIEELDLVDAPDEGVQRGGVVLADPSSDAVRDAPTDCNAEASTRNTVHEEVQRAGGSTDTHRDVMPCKNRKRRRCA